MKIIAIVSIIGVLAGSLTGCAGGGAPESPKQPAAEKPHDPVTLKMFTTQPFNKDDLSNLINGPLQKKYPYITVEPIETPNNSLTQYIATGEPMDLLTIYNGHIPSYKDFNIFTDITPLAQKISFDFGRFDPRSLETVRAISDKGELYGIPYNVQFNALYYNKDIFDRFGVAYPNDGMTWEDAIRVGQKLTRLQDGVQYRGLDPESIIRLMYPLSATVVDGKTNKSLVSGEQYRKLFEMGYQIYSIPGNKPEKWSVNSTNAFIKDRNVAMFAGVNIFNSLAQYQDLNWDLAQYPSYKDKPNVYGMYDLHVMTISKTSKYPDEAMKVLEVLFSDEVQMMSTKETGRVSPLKDPKFKAAFGADMPVLKGKSVPSIFKSQPASAPPFSIHYPKARDILSNQFQQYADNKKDMNSALRDADELINQYILENTK